jgi:4'-phosphopantetheinyl transferase
MMPIRVYHANLEVAAARQSSLWKLLSDEERARASRFRFPEHRNHFIACRGILREILGPRLGIAPARVNFSCNPYGKPALPDSDLCFNLSHSHEHALYAVARGREVGIDIERVDPRFARDQIPERFFSPSEVCQLRSLPADQQTEAFFRCWTRKEAYIKARGIGLGLALDGFDVSLVPDAPPAFLSGVQNWRLIAVNAPVGFAAALVIEGAERESGARFHIAYEEVSP